MKVWSTIILTIALFSSLINTHSHGNPLYIYIFNIGSVLLLREAQIRIHNSSCIISFNYNENSRILWKIIMMKFSKNVQICMESVLEVVAFCC
jgi:hypothetical protein